MPVSTTTPAHPIAEVTVLPVNSSGIGGAAGKTADKLKASGYTNTLAATNAPEGESPMPASIIEYAPGAEADAAAVAKVLSLPESVLKPLAPPWDTDSRKPQVVVLVGGELAAAFAGATTTTTGG